MQQNSFLSLGRHGFHRIAYTEWGRGDHKPTAICAHGLTRNSRDFDALAASLSDTHQVFCPDMAGRGYSDWLIDPDDYQFPLYLADMASMIARTQSHAIDWIGTSMGGLIGMMLAAQSNSPINRLIINDVGPYITGASLGPIGDYIGADLKFANLEQAESYLRTIHAPFGPLSDAQWHHLTTHSTKRCQDGTFALHYDPAIAVPFKKAGPEDVDLWPLWDQIKCPVLILRGQESQLLSHDVAGEMLKRGPDAELVEIPDVGHAPTLMQQDEIDLIVNWLEKTS